MKATPPFSFLMREERCLPTSRMTGRVRAYSSVPPLTTVCPSTSVSMAADVRAGGCFSCYLASIEPLSKANSEENKTNSDKNNLRKPWDKSMRHSTTLAAIIRALGWFRIWVEISLPRLASFFSLETRVVTIPAVSAIKREGICETRPLPMDKRVYVCAACKVDIPVHRDPDNEAAHDVDDGDHNTCDDISFDELHRTVHSTIELAFFCQRKAQFPGLVGIDHTAAHIGIDTHLLTWHSIQGKACSNFGNTFGALCHDDELHDGDDQEDDAPDDEIPSDDEVPERIDDVPSIGVEEDLACRRNFNA